MTRSSDICRLVLGHLDCHITVEKNQEQILYVGEQWNSRIHEQFTNVTMKGIKGWGVTEYLYRNDDGCPVPLQTSLPMLKELEHVRDRGVLTLSFDASVCSASLLVGGKGTQLALLSQLMTDSKFLVPRGFCLTVAAYKKHLHNNRTLLGCIQMLEDVAYRRKQGDLYEITKSIVDGFNATQLSEETQKAVFQQASKQFGDAWEQTTFAVRSSAVGEDGADVSYAGQMETFLGVKGRNELANAIVQCWASSFTYQAMEYRRNHGQAVAADMGVCVQEMVQADAAGVLFTRDPVSGNPGVMAINVSYGLGEAVVSGVTEPDTIYLQRSFYDKLSIKDKVLGSKKTQMVVDSQAGGVKEIETAYSNECCLTDIIAIELGRIGILVEHSFSDPRDIEFAVKDGQIYLLQARPITFLNIESDYELMHEQDGPVIADQDLFTTANAGEMMPQAMTPLTADHFLQALTSLVHLMHQEYFCLYRQASFTMTQVGACFSGHFMLNMLNGLYNMNEYTVGLDTEKSCAFADTMMFGRSFGRKYLPIIRQRYHMTYVPFYKKILGKLRAYRDPLRAKNIVERAKMEMSNMRIDVTHTDVNRMFNELEKGFHPAFVAWNYHIRTSGTSAMWSNIMRMVLERDSSNVSSSSMSDVAMLLSTCPDVLSADVPSALRSMARAVINNGRAPFFHSLMPETAVQWLRSDASGELKQMFDQFMNAHGHRCVREAELMEKPWRMEPEQVVKTIQEMTKSPSQLTETKKYMTEEEALVNIKTPLGFIQRKIIHFLLPRARQAVSYREATKGTAIKGTDNMRQGYRRLAELLEQEGRLPDRELIFFFTHSEIRKLIATRSAKLINKAMRRRKLMPTLMAMQFPMVSGGLPEPIEDEFNEEDALITVKLSGMPVSHGVVRAKCRVVKSLEDAASIQHGEILIVPYTDIGWSPYFPLISGLCTELGGLLSHGAVVAREYGLPCLVSAEKATIVFTTGEEVILDGTLGTIAKVSHKTHSDTVASPNTEIKMTADGAKSISLDIVDKDNTVVFEERGNEETERSAITKNDVVGVPDEIKPHTSEVKRRNINNNGVNEEPSNTPTAEDTLVAETTQKLDTTPTVETTPEVETTPTIKTGQRQEQ
ncbi:PREDICTED: putative phosphoenolpyruvate synthase isoform X2 [Priapulus caudatus]|uniref:Phosphoenolpyruvate synthase isoform X2 n=1 Tax=Priapulus caudatus TaxID=37621 RepID=A0ABM1DWN7_PRICU|nr:PREDICTED: putative phosphoenolpyruvate synthase isoform X2 [Priapulus caudatus]